jgi:CRP/FNR family transcriptional regulator, cyclic AMP receptor protein
MNLLNMLQNEKNTITLPGGTAIFRCGDPGEAMFAVLEGTVEIRHDGALLESIPAGGIFGEMALVDGGARSADAVAQTEVRLAKIDEQRFMSLAQYNPYFTLEVLRITVTRLRRRLHSAN